MDKIGICIPDFNSNSVSVSAFNMIGIWFWYSSYLGWLIPSGITVEFFEKNFWYRNSPAFSYDNIINDVGRFPNVVPCLYSWNKLILL